MRTMKLEPAFRLSGEGIAPCEVSAPYTINHALTEAGLLTSRFSGMGALEGEWAYNRTFSLEGTFTPDGWSSERTYIECEWLLGSGRIFVNGACAGAFSGGALALDITEWVRAGVNALRFEFAPGEVRGIAGSIALRGCWSLHIRALALDAHPFGIAARTEVSAHAAGRYLFRYGLSRGGESLGVQEFEEQLGARSAALEHVLSAGLDEAPLRVNLTVLRAGDECDGRTGWIAARYKRIDAAGANSLPEGGASGESAAGGQAAQIDHAIALNDGECAGRRLELLLDAGVRCFFARKDTFLPEKFLRRADEAGALVCTHDACAPHACICCGLPEPVWTRAIGMRDIPAPERPIPEIALRALGGQEVLDMHPEALLGGCLPGDIMRLSQIMRFLQAETVARAAESDVHAAFDIGGGYGRIASPDLFDEGEPRPAYFALKSAWQARGVHAQLSGISFSPGSEVNCPILVRGGYERVRAELFDSAGRMLTRVEFKGDAGRAGELTFVTGGECAAYLLRVSGWNGSEREFVRDHPILLRGECELEALTRLPMAQVKREGGAFTNASDVLALGVVRADGGSALLPGESAKLLLCEGVNVFAYSDVNG